MFYLFVKKDEHENFTYEWAGILHSLIRDMNTLNVLCYCFLYIKINVKYKYSHFPLQPCGRVSEARGSGEEHGRYYTLTKTSTDCTDSGYNMIHQSLRIMATSLIN